MLEQLKRQYRDLRVILEYLNMCNVAGVNPCYQVEKSMQIENERKRERGRGRANDQSSV